MLLAIRTSGDPLSRSSRSLLGWLVPASLALHAGAIALMPSRSGHVPLPPAPVVIEMSAPPPPPPPSPPPPAETAPPEPPAPRVAAPVRTAAPARRVATEAPAVAEAATQDAPLDFTGMTFSSEGPGVAVRSGPSSGSVGAARPPAAPPARVVTSIPVVPASALARPPRAPGLDAELERNYPPEARRSGISGTAALRVELRHDGRIGKVVIVSESHRGFGAACERTIRAGRWEPPIDREGRPVQTEIKYVCRFEVRS